MAKRTIKINIKLPTGVTASDDLVEKATEAANRVISQSVGEFIEAQKIVKELKKKGIHMDVEEVLARKTDTYSGPQAVGKKAVKTTGARKRVVLNNAQRKSLIKDLKAGAKIVESAEKYGVSTATVMNIKTSANLTKKRPTA